MFIETLAGCCAIQEICELGDYLDGREAMLEFCRQISGNEYDYNNVDSWGSPKYVSSGKVCPAAFYIFSAVEACDWDDDEDDPPVVQTKWYGRNFAAFIKENKLGTVVRGPRRFNHNYRTHQVRVWIWAPDKKALQAWYSAERENGSKITTKIPF
jgi:hypothetical protein